MGQVQHLTMSDVFSAFPPEWADDLMSRIQGMIKAQGRKIIILDDDPTGTQTVHDVMVLTTWGIDELIHALEDASPAVFILTNTRSMTRAQAETLNREIATNLRTASAQTNREFVLISRSDSTLRGHFPLETDILAQAAGIDVDAVLVIPAFMAGGRYTIEGVHYVAENDVLIPVAETPFARDAAFGYQASDLREWVAEKTGGRVHADDVKTVSLQTIRQGGAAQVAEKLMTFENYTYCVMDAVSERDLEVIAEACLIAEQQGKHLLYRTAASFASIRAGITLRSLLTVEDLYTGRSGGGLIVVGSYVPKSSSQLEYLLTHTQITRVEINVRLLLDDEKQTHEIQRVINTALPVLEKSEDVVLYTGRELITGTDANSSLQIGNRISDSLVKITSALQSAARYIVAKGGITSSDLATDALRVKRAFVMGQILPGIPVWQLDESSAESGLIYIVFPGNVGEVEAIAEVVQKLGVEPSC